MTTPLRSVKFSSGQTLQVWETHTTHAGKDALRYEFKAPASVTVGPTLGAVIFEGADFYASPLHALDSDATLLALLGFLTLRPGDTDREYFARYTPAQMAWAQSSDCEMLACNVSVAEEVGGCACEYVWTNIDGWECDEDIRGNVAQFEVLDHGEDGSQYFPGCGVYGSEFENVATGVGDTGAEALDDALEMMAQRDPEARPSNLQVDEMRHSLREPDKSAFNSLDHSECGEDHENDDWNHYVSVRYNVRG